MTLKKMSSAVWIFIRLYTAINSDIKCFFKSTYNQNSLQYTFLVNSPAGAKPKKVFVFVVFFIVVIWNDFS